MVLVVEGVSNMTVNFQSLAPINAPQALGQLPRDPIQPSGMEKAGNALSGLGSSIMDNQIKGQQLEIGKQSIESKDMKLKEQRQSFADGQQVREAMKQGEDQYVKALMNTNPPAAMDYLNKKEMVNKTIADTLYIKSNTTAQNLKNSDPIVSQMGDLVNAANAWKDPKTGAPMNDQQKTTFIANGAKIIGPQAEAVFKNVAPNGFDQNTAIAFQVMGAGAHARLLDAQASKAQPSDTAKRIAETNALRQQAGQAPLSPQEQANISQEALTNSVKSKIPNATDTAIAAADTAKLKTIQERKDTYTQTEAAVVGAKESLVNTPGMLLNPVADFVGLAKTNPNAQALIANLNRLTLLAKTQFNMGSQGFTDADREFVKSMVGGVGNYKGTLNQLLDQAQSFATRMKQQDWLQEYNIQKKGSDGGQQFIADNPEPLVKVKLPDGKTGTVPVTKLEGFIKETKGKVL